MKLASLFDGSGGFPLAACLCGIVPVWASEVDPFPIAVTRKNFPSMQHLGDVHEIDGSNAPPVDVITFGSPCQDMSIAGARAGLDGKRSSLFFEATRIIKEMRSATNGENPRFIVWENVFGSLSSNGGGGLPTSPRRTSRSCRGSRTSCSSTSEKMEQVRSNRRRLFFYCVARPRCSILGSPPTSPSSLRCCRL